MEKFRFSYVLSHFPRDTNHSKLVLLPRGHLENLSSDRGQGPVVETLYGGTKKYRPVLVALQGAAQSIPPEERSLPAGPRRTILSGLLEQREIQIGVQLI